MKTSHLIDKFISFPSDSVDLQAVDEVIQRNNMTLESLMDDVHNFNSADY